MKLGEYLFNGFKGCTNHGCIISPPGGMKTNGSCSCLSDLTRLEYQILKGRIANISSLDITEELKQTGVNTHE